MWKVIKTVWPNNRKHTNIDKILMSKNPAEMANHLNDHFVQVGPTLSISIRPSTPYTRCTQSDEGLPQMSEISMHDIWKALKELSPSKATGSDNIPAHLIKACGDTIIVPLHYICNSSVHSMTFPSTWKAATVTPLFKAGQPELPDNY